MLYNNQNSKSSKQRKDIEGCKRERPSPSIFFVFLNEYDTFSKRTSGKLMSLCLFLMLHWQLHFPQTGNCKLPLLALYYYIIHCYLFNGLKQHSLITSWFSRNMNPGTSQLVSLHRNVTGYN